MKIKTKTKKELVNLAGKEMIKYLKAAVLLCGAA